MDGLNRALEGEKRRRLTLEICLDFVAGFGLLLVVILGNWHSCGGWNECLGGMASHLVVCDWGVRRWPLVCLAPSPPSSSSSTFTEE